MPTKCKKRGLKKYLPLRKKLRKQMTLAEHKLWEKLRAKRFEGLVFRRQQGIGPYIVDFYCAEKGLVVEVDGDTHLSGLQIVKDGMREKYLQELGLRVVRYFNNDVFFDLESVLDDLFERVSTSPQPPPYKGGGE